MEEFLDSKGVFYNGNESDNNDDSYNENNKQQKLLEGFANSCYKISILWEQNNLSKPYFL